MNVIFQLHLLLHSDREPIPDAASIYFVEPTEDNLKRIYKDLKEETYENFNFHFISPINRQKLEDLAQAALSSDSGKIIYYFFYKNNYGFSTPDFKNIRSIFEFCFT